MPFTEQHKAWQQLRRGRYVEFNLVGIQMQYTTEDVRLRKINSGHCLVTNFSFFFPISLF